MDDAGQSPLDEDVSRSGTRLPPLRGKFIRWAVVLFVGFAIASTPVPAGITVQSWRLLAIFAATIVGSIVRPIPGGAMVLLSVSAIAITGALPVRAALAGYSDPRLR